MSIKWDDSSKDSIIREAKIIHDGKKVLNLEFYKIHKSYVAEWTSGISQHELFTTLKKLNYPSNTSAVIESKKKYPSTTYGLNNVDLEEVFNLKDRVCFLSLKTKDYTITLHNYHGKTKHLEFEWWRKNPDTLIYLLNNTSEKLGDKVKTDLEKVLQNYK